MASGAVAVCPVKTSQGMQSSYNTVHYKPLLYKFKIRPPSQEAAHVGNQRPAAIHFIEITHCTALHCTALHSLIKLL
jgi:hypothetical protein